MANTKITVANMAANSIDSDQYVDGSIDTAHIADGQITVGKMAANSVDSAQYVDGSIDTAHYADNSITGAELADNIVIAGTLGSTGKITADAGIDIDNFNIDGTTIALSSGSMTLDVAGDMIIDVDGGDIYLNDGGTGRGQISMANTDLTIISATSDRDLIFKGVDGASVITALTLDMSAAGAAIFNAGVTATGLSITSNTPVINIIESDQSNKQYQIGSFGSAYAINDASASQFRYILDTNGNHIFNEGGVDVDFRVESNDNTHMLFVDGGNNAVGIGVTNPASSLVVSKSTSEGRGGEISIVNPATSAVGNSAALNFGLEPSTYNADNGNAQIKAIITNASNAASDLVFSTWDGSAFGSRVTIEHSGNVGIGTNAPTDPLTIHNGTPSIAFKDTSSNGEAFWQLDGVEMKFFNKSSGGDMVFGTANNTRWKMLAAGHLVPNNQHAYDIGGTNAEVRNIYAQGISFASNAHAGGMASELLDDYETGTWTPLITTTTGNAATMSNATGYYTKVGRLVTAHGTAAASSGANGSGNTIISGFPFALIGGTNRRAVGALGAMNGAGTDSADLRLVMDPGNTFVYIIKQAGQSYSHAAGMNSAVTIYGFHITYTSNA